MEYNICKATPELLEAIWAKDIAAHPGNEDWIRWREQYIGYNRDGSALTYIVAADGEPVGQGTLLMSPYCSAIRGRTALADGVSVGNVNALRIEKAHEGRGYISKLVKLLEAHARSVGYKRITIGVEASEARNLAIYLHWGYTKLVYHEQEDGELVLYYEKEL